MKQIYYRLTFQDYMFNNDSLFNVGVLNSDNIICCKTKSTMVIFLIRVSDYIKDDVLIRAVRQYKLSKWVCLGGDSILGADEKRVLYYVKKRNLSFMIWNDETYFSIHVKGGTKKYFQGNKQDFKLKLDVKFTHDMFFEDNKNYIYSTIDTICENVKKYF